MSDRVRVLSLGAGVQSSAALLLADRGEIEPVDFAVFADTQAEPQEVTDWLKKLQATVKTEILIGTAGNIATDHIEHWQGTRKRVGQAPFFTLDSEGKKNMIRRHCTKEYKVEVVDRMP